MDRKIFQKFLIGTVAGVAATVPMSGYMNSAFRKLPPQQKRPLPPRQITEELLDKTQISNTLEREQVTTATLLSHYGYGGLCGGIYAITTARLPLPKVLTGALHGLGVWGASYLGWLPVAHLHRSAKEMPSERNKLMVAAHLVWGSALGAAYAANVDESDEATAPLTEREG
jgi:uncharacterized membrane protein YagU involved in acid resistance